MKVFINKLQQQERPKHKQQQDAPTSIACFLPTLMKALSDKEPTVVLLAVEALRDLYEVSSLMFPSIPVEDVLNL